MEKILLIEDDLALANGIRFALQNAEYDILQCHNLQDARKVELLKIVLIILDINLPDGSGLDYLQEVRKKTEIPIILLTANDLEIDVVTGLEMGADDYITKPFSLAVLRARVNARLRKFVIEQNSIYRSERFVFDFNNMRYWVLDNQIELSKTEQKLLRFLVENRGRVLERGILVDRIWTDGFEYVDENALSVTISRLRNKIEEDPTKPQNIRTVYGIGYKWED